MIIRNITLNNIRSHIDSLAELTDGINVISGSTGSGKSSILMSIEYALFGKINEGAREGSILLRRGVKAGSVSVELEDEGSLYRITRGLKRVGESVRNDDLNNSVEKDGARIELQNRANDLNRFVANLLKIESDAPVKTFEAITYIKQDELKTLIFDDTQSKQEYIDRLLQLNKYADTYERTRDLIMKMQLEIETDKREIETIKDEDEAVRVKLRIGDIDNTIKKLSSELEGLERTMREKDEKFRETSTSLDKLRSEKEGHERLVAEKREKEKLLNKLKADIEDLENRSAEIKKKDLKIDELKEREIKQNRHDLEIRLKELNSRLMALHTSVYSKKNDLERMEKEIREAEKRLLEISPALDKLSADEKNLLMLIDGMKNSVPPEELDGRIKQVSDLISEIENEREKAIKTGVCQICGSKAEDLRHINSEYDRRLKEYNDIAKAYSESRNKKASERTKHELESEYKVTLLKASQLREEKERCNKVLAGADLEKLRAGLYESQRSYEQQEEGVKAVTDEISELDKKINMADEVKSVLRDLEVFKGRIDSASRDSDNVQQEIASLDKVLKDFDYDALTAMDSAYKALIRENQKLHGEITEKRRELEVRRSELSDENVRLKSLEERLERREKVAKKLENEKKLYELISNLREDIRGIREYVRNKFLDDFRAFLMTKFKEIRSEADYLIDIDNNYNVKVVVENELLDAKTLSGGEKTSVALAYRIALSSVAAMLGGVGKNEMLIMDEPTVGLDREDITALSEAIVKITDIRQILLVTHEDNMKNIADRLISVRKELNESKITY
jgi:exonuclease SbcC